MTASVGRRHVVVVGGGITGLAAAHSLVEHVAVTVVESAPRLGGKILTTAFAGIDAVEEGPDAYLRRVPFAASLSRAVGLGDDITNPASSSASVWSGRLHPIPTGLMLGVPTGTASLARSGLLRPSGKARAALEPLLPRRRVADDNLGALVRARFGDEVHEMLVDPLVGSIYASDTDRLSMSAVPQLADLAGRGRSLLLSGRALARAARGTDAGPIFETPRAGLGALVSAIASAVTARGGSLRLGSRVATIERRHETYRIVLDDGSTIDADGIVVTAPARQAATLVEAVAPEAARLLAGVETSSVAMVTLAVDDWPASLTGSGYLVPKRHQRLVTAASFASNKWTHWRRSNGSMILRVSLGRDGLPVDHLDDATLCAAAVDEVSRHIGVTLAPTDVRLTRWPDAFPQYRPGHLDRVDRIERDLALHAPGVTVAGASQRGIGIPACVQQGSSAAHALLQHLGVVAT
jgi:protoporphyrinogen/coproporphyrinogen III oxidase